MKRLAVLIVLVLVGAGPTTSTSQPLAKLTIKVVDLRNHKGQLIFGVFKSADGFPTDPKKSVNWQIKKASSDVAEFTADLPPGKYGASVLHDENENGKLDTNFMGVPKEGYGETNNPKPKFRAATYKEAEFELPAEGAAMTISLQYF
jgi:uncharacterized protein (DUF2141 family)